MKPIFLSYCPTIDVADLQRWQFLTIKSWHFLDLSRNSLDQLTSHPLIAIVGANVIWRVILISTMMANLTAVIQCPPMIKFFSFFISPFSFLGKFCRLFVEQKLAGEPLSSLRVIGLWCEYARGRRSLIYLRLSDRICLLVSVVQPNNPPWWLHCLASIIIGLICPTVFVGQKGKLFVIFIFWPNLLPSDIFTAPSDCDYLYHSKTVLCSTIVRAILRGWRHCGNLGFCTIAFFSSIPHSLL